MSDAGSGFEIAVPAWRARRLRDHLKAQVAAGREARRAGEARTPPAELEHRAETRRWLAGWDEAAREAAGGRKLPTARQAAKIRRWQLGAGRLRPAQGELRGAIMEAVADEFLSERPVAFGAIAKAHRETVKRCRDAGLPAPKASRYRRWLKASRGV